MDYLLIALILIGIGVVLLGAEILLPTGGVLVVGALLFFAAGVGTILYYGTAVEATVALAGLAVGVPASGFVAVAAWRRLSIGNALEADSGTSDTPLALELAALKGRVGKAVSPLRPSGTVEIDGKRYDGMTEGMMIDAGVWVRCVGARGHWLVVRRREAAEDVSDIDPGSPTRDPLDDLDLGLDK